LRLIQIRYQIWYRLKNKWAKGKRYKNEYGNGTSIKWVDSIYNRKSFSNSTFNFLNFGHKFENEIDWNLSSYGKLWTYNLNYFDFLNQQDLSVEQGLKLIDDYINQYAKHKDGLEPYPTSLRIINCIKFVCRFDISSSKIDDFIGEDVKRLTKNLEFHILANHLLENAFALFFGAYYFQNKALYNHASNLLTSQLDEQILDDGAHYELSVMYHQLMLYRVLDAIQLVRRSTWQIENIENQLVHKAEIMAAWLMKMTFENGDIPLFNDAANNINPTTKDILSYAESLDIKIQDTSLSLSGYRVLKSERLECICDVGNIQPSYQPGHAHADTLGFILYASGKPFLVETGTSTYEASQRRCFERSTSAHNTVIFNGQNSSKIWSSFRVAKRAKVTILVDTETKICAEHDGYNSVIHNRSWTLEHDRIIMEDSLTKNNKGEAFFHLHPEVSIINTSGNEVITSVGSISFNNHSSIKVESYKYAEEWNSLIPAKVLRVSFIGNLQSTIILS